MSIVDDGAECTWHSFEPPEQPLRESTMSLLKQTNHATRVCNGPYLSGTGYILGAQFGRGWS